MMPPTFVDTNVFVYAFLKTKRQLQPSEIKIKEAAKQIISRIVKGEEVATSVVHFSEVCNILEDHLPLKEANLLEKGLLHRENILFWEVTPEDYLSALSVAEDYRIGANDSLAFVLMRKTGVETVYSFDKDFDALEYVQRFIE